MAIKQLRDAWRASTGETRLSILAAFAGLVNLWVGLLLGVIAACRFMARDRIQFERHLPLWYALPTLAALGFLAQGVSQPADDLLRHLTAGELGFDYRAQYPWSDLPKANLWLGFDWALWQLQQLGLSKEFLRQWIPGLFLVLQSAVLYGALRRVLPAQRANPELFLIAGALGLLLVTPRSLLGRPEMLLLIMAATAWLPRTLIGAVGWIAAFLVCIPVYWLGWAYAPFALLLVPERISLARRIGIAAALGLAHLAFWQWYTGDYLGLMQWLKGTLSVKATENSEMLHALSISAGWVFFVLLALSGAALNLRRLVASAGVLLLLVWLALPNQVRYLAAIVLVALPWMYRQFAVMSLARAVRIPQVVVLMALGVAAALTVPRFEPVPEFKLPATARVYSESPYATVFFGEKGISVDPSFALGATKKPWDDLKDPKKQDQQCRLLREGRFTHLIENTRTAPVECGTLKSVQGPWRLWELAQ